MSHTITATVEEVETLIAAFNDKSPSEEVSCDGCPGLCCRCFPLISRIAETVMTPDVVIQTIEGQGEHVASDYLFVKKNFIYLGNFHKNPLVPCHSDESAQLLKRAYYTCRQLGIDGKCLDYENRPNLCRDYGITVRSDVVGCVLDKRKAMPFDDHEEETQKERS